MMKRRAANRYYQRGKKIIYSCLWEYFMVKDAVEEHAQRSIMLNFLKDCEGVRALQFKFA